MHSFSGSWKWEEKLALHCLKVALKLIGCTVQSEKIRDGEMASLREDRVGWRKHQTAKSVSADRDEFGLAGGAWWEAVNTWAVTAEGINSLLLHIFGGSLPPAKTRMVRRPYRSSELMVSGYAERGDRDLSLLYFGQTATSIFSHPSLAQQDKEQGEALLHQLDTCAGDGMDKSMFPRSWLIFFKKPHYQQK